MRRPRSTSCNLPCPPLNSGRLRLSPISPAFIRPTFVGRRISQRDREKVPHPSFRRFSTTAVSSGIAGRERWRIWESLVRTRCKRELCRAQMPTAPASVRSPLTRISLRSGKTLTLTSPSGTKRRRSTRSSNSCSVYYVVGDSNGGGTMRRERALKVVLVVVGLIFSALIYPLTMFVRQEPALAMMLSLYVTLGIFLLLAARR